MKCEIQNNINTEVAGISRILCSNPVTQYYYIQHIIPTLNSGVLFQTEPLLNLRMLTDRKLNWVAIKNQKSSVQAHIIKLCPLLH